MTTAMVDTARELAKVWTGPELVQFVVSEGETIGWCDCGAVCMGEQCTECMISGGVEAPAIKPGDTVPDLTSDANGGIILGVLRGVLKRPDGGPDYQLSMSPAWEESLGNWRIYLYTSKPEVWFHSDELAHLAALVFLAVPR